MTLVLQVPAHFSSIVYLMSKHNKIEKKKQKKKCKEATNWKTRIYIQEKHQKTAVYAKVSGLRKCFTRNKNKTENILGFVNIMLWLVGFLNCFCGSLLSYYWCFCCVFRSNVEYVELAFVVDICFYVYWPDLNPFSNNTQPNQHKTW